MNVVVLKIPKINYLFSQLVKCTGKHIKFSDISVVYVFAYMYHCSAEGFYRQSVCICRLF